MIFDQPFKLNNTDIEIPFISVTKTNLCNFG